MSAEEIKRLRLSGADPEQVCADLEARVTRLEAEQRVANAYIAKRVDEISAEGLLIHSEDGKITVRRPEP